MNSLLPTRAAFLCALCGLSLRSLLYKLFSAPSADVLCILSGKSFFRYPDDQMSGHCMAQYRQHSPPLKTENRFPHGCAATLPLIIRYIHKSSTAPTTDMMKPAD